MYDGAFQPVMASTNVVSSYTIAASTTSANQKLQAARSVRIYNNSGSLAYINFGDINAVATSSHIPIPNGQTEILMVPAGQEYISVLLAAGSGNVFVTPGDGL